MNEWWLIVLLGSIASLALFFLVYPLRANRVLSIGLTPFLLVIIAYGYYSWGGFALWQHYIQQQLMQKRAQQVLQTIKSPQELIERLKAKLDDNPQSAKGWYLLGRLYSSQAKTDEAVHAFRKAHQLQPNNEQFTVNYALSLWQKNNQQCNAEILNLFKTLLAANPNQPDSLSMLAMNAFRTHAYKEAIAYWQRLLPLLPPQSSDALVIRKAIAKAEEYLHN